MEDFDFGLGEDLDASTNTSAPAHWADTGAGDTDAPLPEGVVCFATVAEAPPALLRRLKQIGIVDRADGQRLRTLLQPGQRLVSAHGDLWRWDGFTTAAEAPSAAVVIRPESSAMSPAMLACELPAPLMASG